MGDTPALFTQDRANRTLPLVRRIVEDVVKSYARWQGEVAAFELAAASSRADGPGAEAAMRERAAQRLAAEIDSFSGELSELGIELKSIEYGLIDFPAERDGEPIYLCWKLGEEEVSHWHDRESGFAGRQPLTPQRVP